MTLKIMVTLHNANAHLIDDEMARSGHNGLRLLELLEGNPIVDIAFVADRLYVARNTARNLVNDFLRLGILSALDEGKQRYRTYMYTDYVRLLSQGAEPL